MASGIKGFKSQKILKKKISGYTEEQSVDIERYVTVQEITGDRYALDVLIHGSYETGAVFTVEAGSNIRVIKATGHGAQKGDFVKFVANGIDAPILSVPDANTVILGSELDFDPTGLSIRFLRSVTPSYNPDGSLNVVATTGPIQFRKDGTAVEVMTDSVTPANSVPLPVELRGASGPINITAGDINVQLSDKGANPDITRIGDGTNELQMNASGEAKTHDADVLIKLGDGTQQTKVTDGAGNFLGFNAGGEVKTQDASVVAKLTSLDGKDFASQTTLAALLAELQLKADLAETQPVSLASAPLPTGAATSANQSTIITALASLLTELQLKADLTEAQPVNIQNASVAVTGTFWQATQPVSGPLTDAQLRATPVPISGSVSTSESALSAKFAESSTIGTTATPILNGVTAKKIYVQAPDTNTANIRVKITITGEAATTTSGWQLQPGRSDPFDIGGGSLNCTVSVCSESGTQGVIIQYA